MHVRGHPSRRQSCIPICICICIASAGFRKACLARGSLTPGSHGRSCFRASRARGLGQVHPWMRRRRLREAQADPQAQAAPELIDWRLQVWVRVCDVRVEDGGPRWDSGALLTAQGSQKRQAPSGVQPGSAVNHKSSPPPNVAPSHFKLALLLAASLTCSAHITHLSTI